MTITKSHLLAASTEGVRAIGQYFENTRSDYETAETQFDTGVANRIRSGHAWKGEGVANASMVAETNASALAASKVVTEAGWLVLDGFATAVYNAQRSLQKTLNEASDLGIVVAEDGSVSPSHYYDPLIHRNPNAAPPSPEMGEKYQKALMEADRIKREVQGYLAFATIADNSCSGMLDKLSYLTPSTTDVADPSALAHNRSVLAGALYTRNLALLTRNFWDTATPKAVPAGHDASDIGKIALDVVGIAGCTAGLLTSLGEDATGVAAVFGVAQGSASAAGIYSGVQSLVKDAKGVGDDGGGYKPAPPTKGDELLDDAYTQGKVPEKDLDEGGQGYTPDSPSTPGEPPKYDRDGDLIPYKEFTDVGPRKNSDEVLVVDEKSGHMYYSDDNGRSFLQVA